MFGSVLCIALVAMSSLPVIAAGGYQFLTGKSYSAIRFELYKDLIVLPVKINDTINAKLILDTGTRSMLLFGKRFSRMRNISARIAKVSGWGSATGVDAVVSFPNKVKIGNVVGDDLAVAVVPNRYVFADNHSIDGIIGYELFVKFVVEINYKTKTIYLFDKLPHGHTYGFLELPLNVNKTMPQVTSSILLRNKRKVNIELLIDTGSSLGLAIFSKDKCEFSRPSEPRPIGIGLNGIVRGYDLTIKQLSLGGMLIKKIRSHVVNIIEHPDEKFTYCGSIGAAFLKKHIVIFDYPSSKLFLLDQSTARTLRASTQIAALPS